MSICIWGYTEEKRLRNSNILLSIHNQEIFKFLKYFKINITELKGTFEEWLGLSSKYLYINHFSNVLNLFFSAQTPTHASVLWGGKLKLKIIKKCATAKKQEPTNFSGKMRSCRECDEKGGFSWE